MIAPWSINSSIHLFLSSFPSSINTFLRSSWTLSLGNPLVYTSMGAELWLLFIKGTLLEGQHFLIGFLTPILNGHVKA